MARLGGIVAPGSAKKMAGGSLRPAQEQEVSVAYLRIDSSGSGIAGHGAEENTGIEALASAAAAKPA